MAKRTLRFPGPFGGLVTEPAVSRLALGQASDLLNVYTPDGSIKSRPGYDRINSSYPIKDLAGFDNFLRDNSLTLSTVASGSITVATATNPVVITSDAHGRANGDVVRIGGVVGMVEINNRFFTVAGVTTDTFQLQGEDGEGHTPYTSGGVWHHTKVATSGIVWGSLTQADAQVDGLEIYNGTARGNKEDKDVLTCANILLNAAGSASPITGANYTVEFVLRKWEGFGRKGTTDIGSFRVGYDDGPYVFFLGVGLRCQSLTHMNVADTDDNGYEVEFGVHVGPYNLWDDLPFKIFKRTDGSAAEMKTHAGLNEAPGADEGVQIKVEIYGTSTTTIKVYVNGTLEETWEDSSGPFTAAGYVRLHVRASDKTEQRATLRRQVQMTGLRVYANDGAGNNNETALRVNGLAAYSTQDGNPFLVAKAGNTLLARSSGESTFGLVSVSRPLVNRRDGQGARYALLSYQLGHSLFSIFDAETTPCQGGLPGYTFLAGDRVELLGCDDSSVTLGIYEIDSVDTQTNTLYAKTAPSDIAVSDKKVAYRILGKRAPGTFPALVSGSSAIHADFAIANRMLYLADNSERMVRTEGDVAHLVGLKRPEVAPTVAESDEGAAGGLSGDRYTYKFTYYNPSLGLESSPSPASSRTITSGTITGATAENPVVITSDAHGLANGNLVWISDVVGMVEINNRFFTVAGVTTDTFQLQGEDGTEHTAYDSGGTWEHVVTLTNGASIQVGSGVSGSSCDPGATHVRLYRQNVTNGDETWYFTKQLVLPIDNRLGNCYVFDETIEGAESSTSTVPDATENDVPPSAIACAYHRDRMWWVEADSTKLYFSKIGGPDQVSPTDFLRIGRDDGQAITALWSGRALYLDTVTSILLVLKEHSLWMVAGNSAEDFSVHKLAGIGCLNARASAVDESGNLYFAGAEGIHRWSAQGGLQDLHYAIRPTYFGYELSRLDRMAMAVDQKDGLLLLSVTLSGNSEQDRVLVLHYRKPPAESPGGLIYDWSVWDLGCLCFAAETSALTAASGPGQRKLRFGQAAGLVGTLRGEDGAATADLTSAIALHWTGPKLDLGTKQAKRWHYVSAEFEKQAVATNLKIGFLAGDESTAYVATADHSVVTRKLRPVRRRADHLRPYLGTAGTTAACRFISYEVQAEPLGQR